MGSWFSNAMIGGRTTFGGAMAAIGGVLTGASALGIELPDWAKLLGLMLVAVGPIILGTQARQNNVTSEDVKAAQDGLTAAQIKQQDQNTSLPLTLKGFILLLGVGLMASGCSTLLGAPPSRANVSVEEHTATEFGVDTFKMKINSRGEAAAETGLTYTGETETTPWVFDLHNNSQVTSPQTVAIAEGIRVLLEKTPETIAGLGQQLSAVALLPEAAVPAAVGGKGKLIQTLLDRFSQRSSSTP